MKSLTITSVAATALLATMGIASAQAPATAVERYLGAAKMAAGTDWAGTFLRLCVPVPAGLEAAAAPVAGAPRLPPPRETWYAEPAKVADNLYFLGTKIHSAWAIVGNQGMIIIEALYDYAAKDEILDGLKKLGLDKNKVKYVILSNAHADHDGAPSCCRTKSRAYT